MTSAPLPNPADVDFLGLTVDGDGLVSFELTDPLSRLDGMLYGGTGLTASVVAMEAATGRGALWATTQFVATAGVGNRIDCRAEVLAEGRRVSQVRVTATADGAVLFVAVGSTASERPSGYTGQFGEMPAVEPPDGSPEYTWRLPTDLPSEPVGFLLSSEFRHAITVGGDGSYAPFLSWARMRGRPMTRAMLGFVADMVPSGVARAAGRAGGGRSLDNSIRFGAEPDTDWVLVELEPHFAHEGFGHGLARLWSPDGRLLAVATQSASLLLFD